MITFVDIMKSNRKIECWWKAWP